MKIVFSLILCVLFIGVKGQECKVVTGIKGKAGFEHFVNYNDSGNVTSIVFEENDTTTFGVVKNGLLVGHYSKDEGVKDYESEILRDSLNRVYQVNNFSIEDGEKELYYRFNFEYNKKGQVSRVEKMRGRGEMNKDDGMASEFKYKNGNIVSETMYIFGDEVGTVKMEYSSVKNPLKGSDLYYYFLNNWDWDQRYFVSWLSENVMKKEVIKKLDIMRKEMRTMITTYDVEKGKDSLKIIEVYLGSKTVYNYNLKCKE